MNAPLWPRLRLPLAMLLLLVLGLACFTVREVPRDAGMSREAQLNPWLALTRLLEGRGLTVAASPAYTRLPTRTDLIVLAPAMETLPLEARDALLRWVRAGGHLVVAASGSGDERQWLSALGLRVHRLDGPQAEAEAVPAFPELPWHLLEIPGEGRLRGQLPAALTLHADSAVDWAVRDRLGWRALRLRLGAGALTLTTSLQPLHNRQIGNGDHAALAWRLLDARPGLRVLLVHGEARPSLWHLLLAQAGPFFAALALSLAVWLWQSGQRLGPLAPAAPPPRRRLAEHLEASGRYLARLGRRDLLIAASRQRLLADVARRHPHWRHLPAPALAEALGRRAGLEPAAIARMLQDTPDHLPQLAADLRLIQRLRKAL